jgi:toxin ParE1/3/4
MPTIHQRPAAQRDLVDIYFYLAQKASLALADRFLSNAKTSFAELAAQPLIGSPLTLRHAKLQGMCKWRVRDFEHYLIFYLSRGDGVSIVRVLHSAKNWQRLFQTG